MIVDVGIGSAHITEAEGIIGHEQFALTECRDLADMLERLNTPGNHGTALRRLTDLFWALQNDTDAMILTSDGDK